jgi:hypothetical protein
MTQGVLMQGIGRRCKGGGAGRGQGASKVSTVERALLAAPQ